MLDVQNLSFAYNAERPDAIVALREVSLRVAPGELVAIIGHNGSGKSTLAKLLAAILEPTSGSIMIDDIASTPEHVWEIRRRVGMVFQRPDDQLIANTVIDDVAFGPENLGLPRDQIELRVRESLTALGMFDMRHAQISELSGGEKQRVAIAGVLAMQPNYLILDEPTTMIVPALARKLIGLAHELRDRLGLAVLHITHFMHEIVGFDRVLVMDGGRVLMQGTPREIFARADELRAIGLAAPLVTQLGRRLRARGLDLPATILTAPELAAALAPLAPNADSADGRRQAADGGQAADSADGRGQAADGALLAGGSPPAALAPSEPEAQHSVLDDQPATRNPQPATLLDVRDLHFTYLAGTPLAQPALRGVSCVLYEGETLAILGGTQAGKSTLIEFFNALRVPPPGRVFFEGQDVGAPKFDLNQLRQSVGMVFQQPESQLFEETVGKDVSYVPRRKGLAPAASRAIVERVLTEVGLDYETFRLRYIYALSGGQKRRVAIAGALAAEPRVLILDEPVAGLDPRGRAELAALITELTRRDGLTVVLVGNAVDELAELADRAIVLHDGQVALEGPLRALLRRADELHALGLELSEPAEIALALRPIIPDLPTDLLSLDQLEAALVERLPQHVLKG
ncbi:MAG: energy-coupling factor transporter ATPase [Kouleothrix sp.]|jgi:energy-coupling factor transport system ATP-binding protein|nr:energy-coupling factor transporter ATPase [Kouleothrix sp.]